MMKNAADAILLALALVIAFLAVGEHQYTPHHFTVTLGTNMLSDVWEPLPYKKVATWQLDSAAPLGARQVEHWTNLWPVWPCFAWRVYNHRP